MKEDIDWSQEFSNPDANFLILLQEMETEIKLMQLDLLQIQSPILKGYAQEKYLDFKVNTQADVKKNDFLKTKKLTLKKEM